MCQKICLLVTENASANTAKPRMTLHCSKQLQIMTKEKTKTHSCKVGSGVAFTVSGVALLFEGEAGGGARVASVEGYFGGRTDVIP